MRHRKKTFKLSRTASHRRALLSNLVGSLIREDRIVTTLAKAKAAAPVADKMITLAKADTVAARRRALAFLGDRTLVKKLFSEVGPRFRDRRGGYTRVLKMAERRGDSAPRALLALVEEGEKAQPAEPAKKTRAKAKGKGKETKSE